MGRISTILSVALALALLLVACVPQTTLPTDCDAASVERSAAMSSGVLNPQEIAVCRGQQVTLQLSVDADGTLHLHGYDDAVPAQEVVAGDTLALEFSADLAGQFVIEFHGAEGDAEIGILTVHER